MALWLVEQCRGLADGLRVFHRWFSSDGRLPLLDAVNDENSTAFEWKPLRLFGRHGHIKPENILFFSDQSSRDGYGILKLAGFERAAFMETASRQGVVSYSLTYRPPESDLSKSYGSACDVWALGCVYLEFSTWFCGGMTMLNR